MKIRTKLGLTYLSVSLLALVFISTFIYFYVKDSLSNEILNHLKSVSSIQSHRIEAIIDQNLERIRLVSSRTQLRISLQQYLAERKPEDIDKLKVIIQDALKSISSFSNISILDKKGQLIVSTYTKKTNMDYSKHDFFPTALKRNNAEYFFLDDNNDVKLYLSGPLVIDGTLIGVLLIESDAKNILDLLKDHAGLYLSGETVLGRKDASGEYVEFLAPLKFDPDAALKRKISLKTQTLPMVQALTLKRPTLSLGVDYRDVPVFAATNYIAKTGWGLVVKVDEDEAFASIHELVKYIIIITLAVLFVVAWVSYAFANIISKPIMALTNAAHLIDQGDLSHRAAIQSNDEVGELAGTFNNMTNNLILTQYNLENTNKELQSHREHLEEMVAVRTQELESIIRELEAFSYSVSHDLRSPLRAIDGYSAILAEDYEELLDEEGKLYFLRMRKAAQRMGNLIDDLLELSRINRSEINKREVDLSAKVNAAIQRLSQMEPDRHVDVVIEPDLSVRGDDTLMDVIITNLIGNAWKYTGKTANAKIEFGVINKNGRQVYYIKDNGIGFDMQYSAKLFGAFQRLVEHDEYPGTGIGLATVARAIGRHGGEIWAEGKLGQGATFYFTVSPGNRA